MANYTRVTVQTLHDSMLQVCYSFNMAIVNYLCVPAITSGVPRGLQSSPENAIGELSMGS
jgi:hypothetical protein